ncbi:MAG: prolipoprotein diacylglyceryl transferase [Candidatus Caldatribacteriaceae bacterium]
MHPVIFTIGPLEVRFYGLFMALAIILGALYFFREGRKRGFPEERLSTMVVLVIVFGLAGARLLFVAVNFPSWFRDEPLRVLKIYQGGLAWHGGLLGGVLAAFFYLRFRVHLDFHAVADLTVPGIALGYALIRLANVINGENVGRMTAFSFGRWPVQYIAAVFSTALLVRHFVLGRRTLPDGYRFWSFVFYHQVFRAGIEETLREMPLVVPVILSPSWGVGLLTMVQVTTVPILVFLGWVLWRYLPRRSIPHG